MTHPVDTHVGKRIKHRRWTIGMTQQQLAEHVGIRFQQIQKYETGANRVSASKLWGIAEALGVEISFFFEGLKDGEKTREPEIYSQDEGRMLAAFRAAGPCAQSALLMLGEGYQRPALRAAAA